MLFEPVEKFLYEIVNIDLVFCNKWFSLKLTLSVTFGDAFIITQQQISSKFRIPKNSDGYGYWVCRYGIYWILCKTHPHSNQ